VDPLVGQQLGAYQLVECIGRGGMAVVYKALQPALHRYVAVKILPAEFVHEEGFRARFQQEAETVARLEHPNILPIYDYGQEGDSPYIVMPLVAGGELGDWLTEKPSLDRALQVFSRVLSGLGYAHGQHVVHRDIKPSNIMMSSGDWPLLADFGIAKIIEPSAQATRTGVIVGTPEYMAPEQGEGKAVDQRADLYAMGVVLFRILTGEIPFTGATPMAVILKHLQEPVPSPRSYNAALPGVWDAVVCRALAKNPADRFGTAQGLDEAVQAAWRQMQQECGAETVHPIDLTQLYDSAARAFAQGDWPHVITLCGQLLEIDPAHAAAVQLLTQAHAAQRHDRTNQQAQRAAELRLGQQLGAPSDEGTTSPARETRIGAVTAPSPSAATVRTQPGATPPPAPARAGEPSAIEAPPAAVVPTTAAGHPARRVGPRVRLALGAALGGLVLLVGAGLWYALAGTGERHVPSTPTPVAVTAPSVPAVVPTTAVLATATPSAPTVTLGPTAADLLPACQNAVAAGSWDTAVALCERVRDQDASLPGLASALTRSYVERGKERLAQGGPVEAALEDFGQALATSPDDANAAQQYQWASDYQEGEAALAAGSWPVAAQKLGQLYAEAPDYLAGAADGGLRPKLYAAATRWGEALLQAAQYVDAKLRCEEALAVLPEGEEASTCQASASAALAPPAPAPARTPVPAADATGNVPAPSRGSTSPPAPAPKPAAPAPAPPRAPTGPAPSPGEKPIFIPQR
jgi:tRNA A-37 threonylcarbamoyl transferase component Bud32/tetratricopeptide (TPR) repeat protein